MSGRYSMFQPVYADLGITAFPCSTESKKPLVTNYLKMGIPASRQLAIRFVEANALGIACGKHNGITALDVDTTDVGVLKEAMYRVGGEARVIAKTASGKHHAFYRYSGEKRRIRPWKDLPVDILGGGFIMAVPSLFGKGEYHFVQGGFNDFKHLTTMYGLKEIGQRDVPKLASDRVAYGRRNNWLFDQCMRAAKRCTSLEQVIDIAQARYETNCEHDPPMTETEIATTAAQAWGYEQTNRNRIGEHGAWMAHSEVMRMITEHDAAMLLMFLRATEGPWATFMVPNSWADKFKMHRVRFARARQRLIEMGYIRMVRRAHTNLPALYRWEN